MAIACKITPRIKDQNGNVVDSNLHRDLAQWTIGDRTKQNNIWGTAHSDEFNSKYGDVLERDAHGEFKAFDVIAKTPIKDEMTDDELISGMSEEPIASKTADSPRQAHSLLADAANFNERSPLNDRLEAKIVVSNQTASISFSPVDDGTQARVNEAQTNNGLYNKLSQWLERHGIAVGALEDAEQGQGMDAVTDFSSTKRTASGLVELIRLAQGERGRNALTEEAAHVAIRALSGKDANVDRALKMLKDNKELVKKVLGEEYDQYANRYKGNDDLLAEEAAGKILKSQLQESYEQHRLPTHKSLFKRIADAVLGFFSKADRRSLEDMLQSANASLKTVADRILVDETYEPFDFAEMAQRGERLYALTKKANLSIQDYLQKLIQQTDAEVKTTRRAGKVAAKRKFVKEQLLGSLLDARTKGEFVSGIGEFLNSMNEDLKIQLNKWQMYNWDEMSNDKKAEVIDRCLRLKDTYCDILEDYSRILTDMEEDESTDPKALEAFSKLKEVCNEARNAISDLSRKALAKSLPSVVEFAEQFADVAVVVPFGEAYGKKAGEQVEFAETLVHEDKDIAWYDLWLTSGAMSNSFNVQVISKIINTLQLKIRDEALDYSKRIKDLTIRLEQAGVTDQDFMYERDENGELTGKFIKKGGDAYLALDELRRKYYDDVMEIKAELDSLLPPYVTSLVNAPKVRKDFWEVLKNSKGDKMKVIKDKMKEMYQLTSDDEYTLKDDAIIIDYNGNQVHTIPLRFLAFGKDENMNNMSTDIVESMTLYAQMATNFSIMTRALPHLRNTLELIKEGTEGKISEEKVGEQTYSTFKGVKKRGEDSNETRRINALFDSQLYGMKVYDAVVGGKNVTRIAHNLMQWTALNQYAMNPHGAIQNEITGLIMEASEAFGGRYFGHSDLSWAHAEYTRQFPNIVGEAGKRIKNKKINLFIEKLNILQENEGEQNFNRKTRLGRLFNSQIPYCMTGVGEHNLHTLTGLAMAHRIKLTTESGQTISLWDALETVTLAEKKKRDADKLEATGKIEAANSIRKQISEHPEWNDGTTMTLEIKKGVKTADGKTFDDKSLLDEVRKIMAVNHRLHGIYNEEDKAMAQQHVLGQMGMMYRKWMAPAVYRRFQGLSYSQDLHEWEEGYYRTTLRLASSFVKGLYTSKSLPDMKLSELEKENLKRAGFEFGLWVVMFGLSMMLRGVKKKRKRSYAFHVLNYFVVRTASELNAYVPMGIPREALRLLKSPSAVLSSCNGFLNFIYTAASPRNYETFYGEDALLKSGPHKGRSRVENAFWKSGIPIGYHQFEAVTHLDDAVKFYM